jgi:Zn-finger nucleic acid-binding protein
VIEIQNKKKINVAAFLDDFTRGSSEEELRDKYSLSHAQVVRIVQIFKSKGQITPERVSQRNSNLKIRFGSEAGPPDWQDKVAVDLNTGLVLHCPSCGAAVKRNAQICEYCSAPLDFSLKGKTIICPHCMASTPADARFCIRCAEPIQGQVKEGLVLEDRLCPRCSVPMRGMQVGDFSLIGCKPCGGTFIPHEVFEMMQERSDRVIFSTDFGRRGELPQDQVVKYVRCPVCRTIMNRTNFAHISGVILDTCKGHGVWFDPGELEKIMDFIAHGGLVKAQEADLEKVKYEQEIMKINSIPLSEHGMAGSPGSRWEENEDGFHIRISDVVDAVRWILGK